MKKNGVPLRDKCARVKNQSLRLSLLSAGESPGLRIIYCALRSLTEKSPSVKPLITYLSDQDNKNDSGSYELHVLFTKYIYTRCYYPELN